MEIKRIDEDCCKKYEDSPETNQKNIYKRVQVNFESHLKILKPMWNNYAQEIGVTDEDFISEHALIQRIRISEKVQHIFFEVITEGERVIGFIFYSIDGGIKGLIPPGYGYIMEIYIIPEYRKRNIASWIVEELSTFFRERECPKLYLTPAKASVSFWMKQGFIDSGLLDPDSQMNIHWKSLTQ